MPSAASVPTKGSVEGEEETVEDQDGREAVEEEVVPFDHGADEARADDFLEVPRRSRLRSGRHLASLCRLFAVSMHKSGGRASGKDQ